MGHLMLCQNVLMQDRRSPRVNGGEAEQAAGEQMTRGELRMDLNCLKGCNVQEAAELGLVGDGYKRAD